jgi:hypothetical protein
MKTADSRFFDHFPPVLLFLVNNSRTAGQAVLIQTPTPQQDPTMQTRSTSPNF